MIDRGCGGKKRTCAEGTGPFCLMFDGSGDQIPDAVEAVSVEALASSS